MLLKKGVRFLGLIILAYILTRIDWLQLKITVGKAVPFWLVIAFLINIPQTWFKSSRWQLLLYWQNHPIKNREAFLVYLSSIYLGFLTPGRLGEFVKAMYLKQLGITSFSRGFSSVLVDRLYDLYLLFVIAMLGLVLMDPFIGANLFGWAGVISATMMPLFIIFAGKIEKFLFLIYHKFFESQMPAFAKEGAKHFGQGVKELMNSSIWLAGFLTVFSYTLFFLQCFLILKAFEIPLSYLEIVQIMAITNLFSLLPISVAGLGTREAALIFLMTPMGINLETILIYSMGVFLVFYLGGGIIGAFAWWLRPLNLQELIKRAE